MADMELSLDSLKFANVYGFERKFGKKKDSSQNGGSLLTREFNEANALPFDIQRPVRINSSTRIKRIEYDPRIDIVSDTEISVVLCDGEYTGQTVTFYNTSEVAHTLEVNGEEFELSAGKEVTLYWAGRWKAECRVPVDDVYVQYGGMKFPQELFPCTKWENISKSFEGEFFRVAGGNSASAITEYNGGSVYVKKVQESQNKSHDHSGKTGSMNRNASHSHNLHGWSYGIQVGGSEYALVRPTGADNWGYKTMDVNTNHEHPISSDGGDEARPYNSAVQLWQRIS